jgi:hypothetical protein
VSWFISNLPNHTVRKYAFKTFYNTICYCWFDNRCRNLFRYRKHSAYWRSIGNSNYSVISFLKDTEETRRFFREYKQHSTDIGKIIFEGWGLNSSLFATCEYRDGRIVRTNTSELQLKDIGLARQHLQNGYPDVWRRKREAEDELNELCDNIENKIRSYQNAIFEEIDKEIKIESGSSSTLIRRDNDYIPVKTDFQSFYYRDNLLSSIFDELTDRQKGREPEFPRIIEEHMQLENERNRYSVVPKMKCSYRDRPLAYGSEKQVREVASRFQKLTSDPDIDKFVKDYYELEDKLTHNEKRNQFYESIQNIWKSIKQNGELLKGQGTCTDCPRKSFLRHF